VTGGSGFLGRHMLGSEARRRFQVIAPPSSMLDITDERRVFEQITEWRPAAVVHLAYRRDRASIVPASSAVARAAAKVRARLVHLSTDVVFGGRSLPYHEDDLPRPTIDYGRWKAEAEQEVFDAHPNALIVRTSLLYGTTHQAPIQRDVVEALQGRSSMTFFSDEFRCPAHAGDVAAAVLALVPRTDVTGVLHLAGPEAISRADFARATARWLGLDPSGLRTSTIAASGLDRPARVVLDSSKAAALGLRCRSLDEALVGPSEAPADRRSRRRSS
jgi:dTDP-4-dehydrorhamnose reductase